MNRDINYNNRKKSWPTSAGFVCNARGPWAMIVRRFHPREVISIRPCYELALVYHALEWTRAGPVNKYNGSACLSTRQTAYCQRKFRDKRRHMFLDALVFINNFSQHDMGDRLPCHPRRFLSLGSKSTVFFFYPAHIWWILA